MIQRRPISATLLRLALLMVVGLAALPGGQGTQVAQAAGSVAFELRSARTEPRFNDGAGITKGDLVTGAFKYIITKDDVGIPQASAGNAVAAAAACNRDSNPNYPAGCNQPAVRSFFGSDTAPVMTGEKADLATQSVPVNLPDGRYLVSITADGFKIDGEHFTIPSSSGLVTVQAQPFPLPLTTIKVQIFNDNASTNGQMDVPDEVGLAGFEVHLNDVLGVVTTDWFGNPICTSYQKDVNGSTILGVAGTVSTGTTATTIRDTTKSWTTNQFAGINVRLTANQGSGQVRTIVSNTNNTLTVSPAFAPAPRSNGGVNQRTQYLIETGKPTVVALGGKCISDATGVATIENMGPDRYTVTAVPPQNADALNWVQTTTLEGNHDWDIWPQEGGTGYDTEALVAGEPFPMVAHGFAHTKALTGSATGEIKGRAVSVKVYVPPTGGLPYPTSGYAGAKIDKAIDRPWVALSDLNNGDQQVYLGRGNSDGTFDIKNVPDSDYQVTVWDGPQEYILDLFNASVRGGQVTDLGNVMLTGWYTRLEGTVFIDTNGNGKQDAGEAGLPRQLVLIKTRNNSVEDQGTALVQTDNNGHYVVPEAYPLGSFLVEEVYNDRFQTTGVTFQSDNMPNEKTILSAGVDINFLPIIGLSARIDWGVKPYAPGTNGGIVGTVTYDSTRNETDPRFATTEDYQPGIPNFTVKLYQPVPCGTSTQCATAESGNSYQVGTDGAFTKGQLLNIYTSETWHRPTGCATYDIDGKPVDFGVLPTDANKPTADCIEAPLQSVQVGTFGTGNEVDFASDVDGNYGFGDGCFAAGGATDEETCASGDPTPLPAGDYLVEANSPQDTTGNDLYKVTTEEDVNVFNGDQFVPQIPPPACAGALHTVDVAGILPDGPNAVTNDGFVGAGGSPYEGQQRPLCNVKMVPVQNGKSIAPNFNFFTDVPIPGRLYGLVTDDLNLSTRPSELLFGEKAGVANMPVGFYDYSGRLVTTVLTDKDGFFDVQLPSVSTYNCPLPAGPCPNVYRLVGNDPGTRDHLNPTYNPQYRVITTNFQVWPGLTLPADLAPTQIGVTIEAPGSNNTQLVSCALDMATPQLFAVSTPYVNGSGAFTIQGQGFGSTQGTGNVTLDNTINLPVSSWSDISLSVSVPAGTSTGPHQLKITSANGQSTINGLTFHVLGGGYNPQPFLVGPGKTYSTIQSALDAAATYTGSANNRTALVVVYPGANDPTKPTSYNPRGAYYENIVMHSPVKIQGVGPGGVYANGTPVFGSALDGILFGADGDAAYVTDWYAKVNSLTWSGNQNIYDGSVVYVLAQQSGRNAFGSAYTAAIDGFDIQGGDQLGFPNNINSIGGLPTGQPVGALTTQGGGIFANAYASYLQITNNLLKSNGGAYGAAIRLGTPNLPAPDTNNHNDHVKIANNRMIANGGTNLAGAIGMFNGSDSYEIAGNDLCGNFSAEYGGGISHFGLSPNGKIHDNRIYFNRSYDEGGAIMIAGEMPVNANANYGTPNGAKGAGAVDIYNNQIQANLANDDGGGIRFLQAGNFPFNVYNNMIVNNVSTHEGGGVALDDAPNVRFYNNTVMKNITTATAATSDGLPAPAGLSTGPNSVQLQATLPGGSPLFSNPLLFNDIFWDNRAGTFNGGGVTGIGATGDASPINLWDLGSLDTVANSGLAPTNSMLNVTHGVTSSPTNQVGVDPNVVSQYSVSVNVLPWRNNLAFNNAALVAVEQPANLLGNYHLNTGSPAQNHGAGAKAPVSAPAFDIDNQGRPGGGSFDIGADEVDGTTTGGGGGGGGGTTLPMLTVLDNFNRANANTLNNGSNWSQTVVNINILCGLLGLGTAPCAAIRVIDTIPANTTSGVATSVGAGQAIWNTPAGGFGAKQGAAFTFANTTLNNAALILKAGSGTTPANFIRVLYQTGSGGQVVVATTTNGGLSYTTRGTLAGSFANGDTLSAVVDATGTLNVWKTSGATTTLVGTVAIPTTGSTAFIAGTGRIGMQLPAGVRVDDFSGGTTP